MRAKMRLDLDQLLVDTFVTEPAGEGAGTVLAHDSGYTNGTDPTCQGRPTCNAHDTCNYDSCDGVCGTYYCFPGDSGLNDSCQWTCDCASIAYPC
jgi:hypothetical protein